VHAARARVDERMWILTNVLCVLEWLTMFNNASSSGWKNECGEER